MRLSLSIPMLMAVCLTGGVALAERPDGGKAQPDRARPERQQVAKPERLERPLLVQKDDVKRSHGDVVDKEAGARPNAVVRTQNAVRTQAVGPSVERIKPLKDAPNACNPGSEGCATPRANQSPGATAQSRNEKSERNTHIETAQERIRKEKIMGLIKAAMCSRGACGDER
ncbi:MAG: hypothetical protein U0165_03005 [Polyangiaceae bacterium]